MRMGRGGTSAAARTRAQSCCRPLASASPPPVRMCPRGREHGWAAKPVPQDGRLRAASRTSQAFIHEMGPSITANVLDPCVSGCGTGGVMRGCPSTPTPCARIARTRRNDGYLPIQRPARDFGEAR
jgi:hypothetical protein